MIWVDRKGPAGSDNGFGFFDRVTGAAEYFHGVKKSAANQFYILSQIIFFQAGTIPFDINFMNFEDPDVFKRLTGPDYKKYWRETFGYDWVNQEKLIG